MDDFFQELAWRDFMTFAIGHKEFLDQFEKETGRKPPTPAKSPMDAMIDEATGHQEKSMKQFTDAFAIWATVNLWGVEFAPAKMRKVIESMDAGVLSGKVG